MFIPTIFVCVLALIHAQAPPPPPPPSPNTNLPPPPPPNGPKKALVTLSGTSGVNGIVTFQQSAPGSAVTITGSISGLAALSTHGFHIHQYGDLSNGCTSMGSHFNPANLTHGAKESSDRHVGDLGNIVANDYGVALISISPGPLF